MSIMPERFSSTSAPKQTTWNSGPETRVGRPSIAPLWRATATYDAEAGAHYVRLTQMPVCRTVSLSDLVMVDYDALGLPVGVEILVAPTTTEDGKR